MKKKLLLIISLSMALHHAPARAQWWHSITEKFWQSPYKSAGFLFFGYATLHSLCSAAWHAVKTTHHNAACKQLIDDYGHLVEETQNLTKSINVIKQDITTLGTRTTQLAQENEHKQTRINGILSQRADHTLIEKNRGLDQQISTTNERIAKTKHELTTARTTYAELMEQTAHEKEYNKLVAPYVDKPAPHQSVDELKRNYENCSTLSKECKKQLFSEIGNYKNRITMSFDDMQERYLQKLAPLRMTALQSVYALLGLDWIVARQLPLGTITEKIRNISHKNTARILSHLFEDAVARENFDTILAGENAWNTLAATSRCECIAAFSLKYEHENLANNDLTDELSRMQNAIVNQVMQRS